VRTIQTTQGGDGNCDVNFVGTCAREIELVTYSRSSALLGSVLGGMLKSLIGVIARTVP
jgi:membrane protein YqaA with SNARE-associated domain